MKLLYIVHQFYPETVSGTERFLFNLCSGLQRDGHSVQVVTYGFQERQSRRENDLLVREYLYNSIPVTAIRHAKVPINIHSAWSGPEIAEFAENWVRRRRPDLVHIVHPMRLGGFAEAAMKAAIPYGLTLTDFWTICPKITLQTSSGSLCRGPRGGDECARWCPELDQQFVRSRLHRSKRVLEGAKFVAVPSRFVASVVQAEFPELSVRVIPHGVRRTRSPVVNKKYRGGEKVLLAYTGGLAPHKAVHILVAAFRQLKGDAELRIYGSHSEQPDYLELLQKLAAEDPRIRFCGSYSSDQLDAVLQEIDLLVVPSVWYETYSFSAHEALTRGIPVVGSRLGAIGEAVEHGVSGFMFSPGNIEDLRAVLQRVVDNPAQLNEIKARLATRISPMLEEEAYLYQHLYAACVGPAKQVSDPVR